MKKKTRAKRQGTFIKRKEDIDRKWFIFDAKGKTLGRFASEVARVLQGKHRCDYTPHIDGGDCVIIINSEDIRVTGEKEAQIVYRNYTGHIGGMRETPFRVMKQRNPGYIISHAVKKMLPKNKNRDKMMTRLRVFVGENHQMEAQKPIKVSS